ncbi:Replication protein P [Endozoicomonas sp. SM1973]|uniref:Replication protein P n=1 Tax=Spartinivicinus marinus TaxID=2994442 RepID=A0A853IAW7_9GAMM|nr:replication protein P [Spartinivicinus marinus]MCX4025074.1 replication protein P [Spartinivicinus marinus]NYZ68972.1 Replication protein P [Spartinivicinus marinus]
MKKSGEIISGINFNQPQPQQAESNSQDVSEHAAQLVNLIFRELQGIFPAWKQAFADTETLNSAKRNWTKGFIENKILKVEQVRIGLNKARQASGDFIPSIGKFISWCNGDPEDFGLPKPQLAYREACQKAHELNPGQLNWSHQAVYSAARNTGFFELKSMPERDIFPVFERNYELICQQVMAGEPLQDIPKALTDETPKSIAEKNKAYHDVQQQKYLQQKGFDQLDNPREAMSEIYRMLGRK